MNDEKKLRKIRRKKHEVDVGIANTMYGTVIGGVGAAGAYNAMQRARKAKVSGMPKTEAFVRKRPWIMKPAKKVLQHPKKAAGILGAGLMAGHIVNAGADMATGKLLIPERMKLSQQQKRLESKVHKNYGDTGITQYYDRDEEIAKYATDTDKEKRRLAMITGGSTVLGGAAMAHVGNKMLTSTRATGGETAARSLSRSIKAGGKGSKAAILTAGTAIPVALISHRVNTGRSTRPWS